MLTKIDKYVYIDWSEVECVFEGEDDMLIILFKSGSKVETTDDAIIRQSLDFYTDHKNSQIASF